MKVAGEKDRKEGRESQQSELQLPRLRRRSAPVLTRVLKVWALEKQHWHQLPACEKYFLPQTTDTQSLGQVPRNLF